MVDIEAVLLMNIEKLIIKHRRSYLLEGLFVFTKMLTIYFLKKAIAFIIKMWYRLIEKTV